MTHTGRKPLGTGHVDRLTGSAAAKQRMKVLLEPWTRGVTARLRGSPVWRVAARR
jgi:hypothetical protein